MTNPNFHLPNLESKVKKYSFAGFLLLLGAGFGGGRGGLLRRPGALGELAVYVDGAWDIWPSDNFGAPFANLSALQYMYVDGNLFTGQGTAWYCTAAP